MKDAPRSMGDYSRLIPPTSKKYPPPPKDSEMSRSLEAYLTERRDAQPLTVSCGLCDGFSFAGTAGECRAAALEHRKQAHPETLGRKRPGRKKGDPGAGLKPMWPQAQEDRQASRLRGAKAAGEAARARKAAA